MQSVPFLTRARTIDHLGREQIADCPTAVSELWKNAFDAYARDVALHIFDGEMEVAALVDNGHGMNAEEFINRWLVVGTDSKVSGGPVPLEDRNGLPERPKQGQKGIGRLSCAALGSLLLLVSKRKQNPFVAAMVDWRLFENPFLMLQDLRIPVIEFERQQDLFSQLPELFSILMGNLTGDGSDPRRDERIVHAWAEFEKLERAEHENDALWLRDGEKPDFKTTQSRISETVINATFSERHINQWPVWAGTHSHGTALILANISFDLKAQLPFRTDAPAMVRARRKLFETLSSFSDPFVSETDAFSGYAGTDFSSSVRAWRGAAERVVVDAFREFDLSSLESLEHVLDGEVDDQGVFRGRVKAYGNWLEGVIEIRPSGEVPKRSDTRVGPFRIRAGSWTDDYDRSTLSKERIATIREQADRYAGFMVYRDGLRVMPYGREDNDFFEIEKRRTKHAGRYFWANRRTFGRVAITRMHNPNLKDKAGREGIIDNRASKAFRDLVENILVASAQRYFGTDSHVRKQLLPELEARNAAAKAAAAREQLTRQRRRDFRSNLAVLSPKLFEHLSMVETLAHDLRHSQLADEGELLAIRERISQLAERQPEFVLGDAPKNLPEAMKADYAEFREGVRRAQAALAEMRQVVSRAIEDLRLKDPRQVAYSELNRNAAFLHRRIRQWAAEANRLLDAEKQRIRELAEARNKVYHAAFEPRVDDVAYGRAELSSVLEEMHLGKERQDKENAELFEPYVGALRILQQSIDLEGLASFGIEQASTLRDELDRLNALAQLGITVEIIGHEMESLDTTIRTSLAALPAAVRETAPYKAATTAHEALTERLKFLSPLKLSGEITKEWISGDYVCRYVKNFFGKVFEEDGVTLHCSASFKRFSVYEQPARILPVFLNLVNNARYWALQRDDGEKKISLDVRGGEVFVADDGPGIDGEDLDRLFTLFFTRKTRGGRGVGLYLCRSNLAAGGHSIRYVSESKDKVTQGANFAIKFRGGKP